MEIHINKTRGFRNDLLAVISHSEIDDTIFHIINRCDFMKLPGLVRPKKGQKEEDVKQVAELKEPVENHLKYLKLIKDELVDKKTSLMKPLVQRRLVVIGSRNVGNNHGFVAWQRDESPCVFHIKEEPFLYDYYSCLVRQNNGLVIRDLNFKKPENGKHASCKALDNDSAKKPIWAVFGQQILKNGKVVSIEQIIDRFYDIRHVFAYLKDDPIENMIYDDYPDSFCKNALKALL